MAKTVKHNVRTMPLRLWLAAGVLVAAVALGAWELNHRPGSHSLKPGQAVDRSPHLAPAPGIPWFEDVTAASGIDFQHFDSSTPTHYLPETLGSGVAWIDYNNDGWPDLFCVQDGPIRPDSFSGALPTCKLYRNNGDGTFTDVTLETGLTQSGFGMGCAVGDYDNDGYDDLLVTYWGKTVLYHNEPDGKGGRHFVDVTSRAGIHNPHWGTSCAWGDIDGDGFLDLYICNYSEIDLDHYPVCSSGPNKTPYSCPPTLFPSLPHKLYRNNGNGTFTDITEKSGIAAASPSPGLGVILADLDGDGRLDIYVANDLKPSFLFHNQGGGRFEEKGFLSGCALGPQGVLISGMGVDAGDVDGSGRPSLLVTNFQNKPNVLFRNKGGLFFQDASYASGLGAASIERLGFGIVFFDADLDGHLDAAVANGHVSRPAQELSGVPYAQEAQLFTGNGAGKFEDVSGRAGPYFGERHVGRGLAWADYDNDGLADLVFSHNAGRVALLRNQTKTDNHWIRLELIGDGKKSNRNAIGARVEIEAGGRRQVRFLNGGGSYLSASERRLLVGLGKAARAERVHVR